MCLLFLLKTRPGGSKQHSDRSIHPLLRQRNTKLQRTQNKLKTKYMTLTQMSKSITVALKLQLEAIWEVGNEDLLHFQYNLLITCTNINDFIVQLHWQLFEIWQMQVGSQESLFQHSNVGGPISFVPIFPFILYVVIFYWLW